MRSPASTKGKHASNPARGGQSQLSVDVHSRGWAASSTRRRTARRPCEQEAPTAAPATWGRLHMMHFMHHPRLPLYSSAARRTCQSSPAGSSCCGCPAPTTRQLPGQARTRRGGQSFRYRPADRGQVMNPNWGFRGTQRRGRRGRPGPPLSRAGEEGRGLAALVATLHHMLTCFHGRFISGRNHVLGGRQSPQHFLAVPRYPVGHSSFGGGRSRTTVRAPVAQPVRKVETLGLGLGKGAVGRHPARLRSDRRNRGPEVRSGPCIKSLPNPARRE